MIYLLFLEKEKAGDMTQVQPAIASVKSETTVLHQKYLEQSPIDRILQKLSHLELPAKEHFESYMRHKWRLNHKRSTLQGSFASVKLFLEFYGKSGKKNLEEMERADLEAFIATRLGTGQYAVHDIWLVG